MTYNTKNPARHTPIYSSTLVLVVGTLLVLGMFAWSHYIREQQISHDYPRDDALMEIATNISDYHLWLEKYLAGDKTVNIKRLNTTMDKTVYLANALLSGGISTDHNFEIKPFSLSILRKKTENILSLLAQVNKLAKERIEHIESAGIGTKADIEFDKIYDKLSYEINMLSKIVNLEIAQNEAASKSMVKIILFLLVSLITASVMGLRKKERQVISAQNALMILNEELEQRIKERTTQLEEAQEKLVRKERLAAIGQISSSIGHDLRNPLGVISNSIYFLKMKINPNDEKLIQYLDIIDREVERSNQIISNILDFARTKPLEIEELEINQLIKKTLACDCIKKPENIVLKTSLDENIPKILADQNQIRQAFINIITNAFQAMPSGGTLEVSTTLKNNFVQITFKNNGEAIAKENLKKIFEPLFTTKAKGIGLGMTIVKNIIDQHKGKIEVESEVGKGASFNIHLPLNLPKDKQNAK